MIVSTLCMVPPSLVRAGGRDTFVAKIGGCGSNAREELDFETGADAAQSGTHEKGVNVAGSVFDGDFALTA